MTEAEWLSSPGTWPMLEHLWAKVNERKLRLFGCACCYRIWHLMADEEGRMAVAIAERYADGLATDSEMTAANLATARVVRHRPNNDYSRFHASLAALGATNKEAVNACWTTSTEATKAKRAASTLSGDAVSPEREIQAMLFRDISGNPFRPVTIDPRWLSCAVVDLATAIYDERAFERMALLADALVNADCENEEIIAHCLGKRPHVRGCWVIDLILGKE
jgi:hypothetical protein